MTHELIKELNEVGREKCKEFDDALKKAVDAGILRFKTLKIKDSNEPWVSGGHQFVIVKNAKNIFKELTQKEIKILQIHYRKSKRGKYGNTIPEVDIETDLVLSVKQSAGLEGVVTTDKLNSNNYTRHHESGGSSISKTKDIFLGSQQTASNHSKKSLLEEIMNKNQLKIENHLLNSFYCSLKTKGFVILGGMSGTGKTKMFEHFVKLFPEYEDKYMFLSVKPDFRDSSSLLGYFNPLKGEYQATKFLNFIYQASQNLIKLKENADPFFVLLDEMNLARVEYYFADFLSVLETIKDENGFTTESIKLASGFKPENSEELISEIWLPQNLYFIGTVNVDETTHMFSPKVLDRAFTIEFEVSSFNEYIEFLKEIKSAKNDVYEDEVKEKLKEDFINSGNFTQIDKKQIITFAEKNPQYIEKLEKYNTILRAYDLHFGYRVFDEIIMFLSVAEKTHDQKIRLGQNIINYTLDEAFDHALKMKILPKFHGTRKKLETPIKELLSNLYKHGDELKLSSSIPSLTDIQQDYNYPFTAQKLLQMLYQLDTTGFAAFM